MNVSSRHYAALGVLVALAVGCGSENKLGRRAVSGEVTLKGAPLDQGSIQFSPEKVTKPVQGGAVIRNGTFALDSEKGLTPGVYRVRLFAPDPQTIPVAEEMPGMVKNVAVDRAPPEFNTKSEVTCEVKESGDNHFVFAIP